ncbi:hypothetical protein CPT_Muldoon_109 [Serratia phage Muldoon]|uniref:Valyl-tRNA synthetase modifier n=1 Tax=Serratia phage Muldoon TaxID=2601678 RepID=A0A5P8PHD3_9CAUD|nr:valyl tRNA synthetase modifier [Serratia phage Muldoon]QFR56064.1 hypothetical protein CPT_Muldoon_109 [Serratia phage Muldoon]WDS61655.1 hypothetical protein [Cronobacter phage vB_Cdu_VP8]
MVKLVLGTILGLSLAMPATAKIYDPVMEENLKIARMFCVENSDCVNLLALELDDAYRKGKRLQASDRPWNVNVNRQTKELTTLCDTAPNKQVCNVYRIKLLERFIEGLDGL